MTDLDTLLQPIPGDDPCGEDMVFSAEFDQIREARRFDQPGLEQGDWVIDLKEADWPQVVHLCGVVLRERSKEAVVATEEYVQNNPWQSVGIAAGVGFLLGLLATRR